MKALFEFVNDYRDSLLYGSAAVLCIFLFMTGKEDGRSVLLMASDIIWAREYLRMLSWCKGEANIAYAQIANFMTIIASLAMPFCFHPSSLVYLNSHPWIWGVISMLVLLQATIALGIVFIAGGVRSIFRTYWKHLFDWPRKQKPPKHRWQTAKRKITDALAKFLPGFIPSPMGC
jgi:hypothetical protein